MRRHWPVFEAYLVRGAVCWLSTRAIVSSLLWLAGLTAFRLSPIAALEMVALSVVVAVVDTFRRREGVLLANLAVHPLALGSVLAIPATLGELLLRLTTGVVR